MLASQPENRDFKSMASRSMSTQFTMNQPSAQKEGGSRVSNSEQLETVKLTEDSQVVVDAEEESIKHLQLEEIQEQLKAIHASQQLILTKMELKMNLLAEMQKQIQAMHATQQAILTKMDASHQENRDKMLEEYVNPEFQAELAESQYFVYFLYGAGLFRVDIPHDVKIKTIFHNPSNPLPYNMGLFSHHHKVYMVGGHVRDTEEYSPSVYMFDPNRLPKLPVRDPSRLDKPKELCDSFKLMVAPKVIRSGDQIYFLSFRNFFRSGSGPFDFQSFDLTKNHFKTLESPPYQVGYGTVGGFFSLCGYIYLFITGFECDLLGYIFDTRSSKWKEHILDQLDERDIPIPCHIGDVGLSDEFSDKSRILITLNVRNPTAYRIQLCDDGSLKPKSYRCLDEVFIHREYKLEEDYTHLLDIGLGRFCVVYRSVYKMPLLIYVFKIDFEVEHHNQIAGINKPNPSSQVLFSKKFEDSIPLLGVSTVALCLASTTSNEGRDMAATRNEGKDVEKKDRNKSRQRRRGGTTSSKRN